MKVRTQDLETSLASLNLVGANMLGVVINLLPTKGADAYAYSYYSYQTKPDSRPPTSRSGTTFNGSHVKARRRSSKDLSDTMGRER